MHLPLRSQRSEEPRQHSAATMPEDLPAVVCILSVHALSPLGACYAGMSHIPSPAGFWNHIQAQLSCKFMSLLFLHLVPCMGEGLGPPRSETVT